MKKVKLLGTIANYLLVLLLTQSCTKQKSPEAANPASINKAKRPLVDEVTESVLSNGTYRFVTLNTFNGTNLAMRPVGGVSAAQDALVEQRAFTTNNNGHEWRAIPIGNGNYNIFVQGSLSYSVLTVLGTATPASGMSIGVKSIASGNARQIWKIEHTPYYNIYTIKLASNPALAVNITPAGSTAEGAVFKLGSVSGNSSFLIYRSGYKDIDATNFFKRDDATGWNAGDGTNSVSMSNGKVLWIMDDSNISTFSNGTISCNQAMVRNVAMLQTKDNWTTKPTTVLGPGNTTLIKSQPGTPKINWATAGFQLDDIVYIWCNTLEVINSVLENVGPDVLAKYQVSTNTIVGFIDLANTTASGYIYKNGFIVEGGYVYAYAQKGTSFTKSVYVARFAATAAGVNGAWKYYKGGDYNNAANWVTDVTQSADIGQAETGNFYVHKVGANKYVCTSGELSVNCGNGRRIYASSATTPVGPFSPRKVIYTIDDTYNGNAARFYWAITHPEYTNSSNELLLTYNVNSSGGDIVNSPCGTQCTNGRKNPNVYRPRAIRIPLKLINSTF